MQTWNSSGFGPWSVGKTFTTKELSPTWSRKLDPANRFTLVLDGLAALDNETGLTWERTPAATTSDWYNADYFCMLRTWGGRRGWRAAFGVVAAIGLAGAVLAGRCQRQGSRRSSGPPSPRVGTC